MTLIPKKPAAAAPSNEKPPMGVQSAPESVKAMNPQELLRLAESAKHRRTDRQCVDRNYFHRRQRRPSHLSAPSSIADARRDIRASRPTRNDGHHSPEHGHAERPVNCLARNSSGLRKRVRRNKNRLHAAARCTKQMTATPYKLIRTSVYEGVTEVRFYDETRQHVKERTSRGSD
jgi:hypothetical protein